jgi:hypothetical protein
MNIKLTLLKVLSFLGLAGTLVPSFLVFSGWITLETYKSVMLGGTVLYLATAPWWINKVEELRSE